MIGEISVHDLQHRNDAGEELVLLDVREPDDVASAAIPWATVIPMMEIPGRIGELPHDMQIIVMCHHGSRSERVAPFLTANGYDNVVNLEGGIDAWSTAVDPTVPRY
jgi:rhodanese-related sulfurtransferase